MVMLSKYYGGYLCDILATAASIRERRNKKAMDDKQGSKAMKYIRRGKHIKTMRLLSLLLGIGGIAMLILAGALNLSIGLTIGLVMLLVSAGGVLVIAFVEGSGNDIGSYRNPRT
jgi:hypothetical protein